MNENRSDWLTRLREEMIAISSSAAREYWPGPTAASPPYFNYRLEHIRQVERNAIRLSEKLGGDNDIILASVWIHDRFQPHITGPDHPMKAVEWTRENLDSYGFPADKVEEVCFAIAHHSDNPGIIPGEAREAQILWDADKLTKLGPINIISFLCLIPAFPEREITYTEIARHGLENLKEAESLINKFYFEASRKWASDLFKVQKAFYNSLVRDIGTA